mgnify:CR=1 FL=1
MQVLKKSLVGLAFFSFLIMAGSSEAETSNDFNELDLFFYGDLDNGNPDSLSESQLDEIKNSNFINYLGHIDIKKELHNPCTSLYTTFYTPRMR